MSTPNDQPDLFAPDQTGDGAAADAPAADAAELAQVRRERAGIHPAAQSRWPLSRRWTASTFSRLACRSARVWRLS